MKYFWILLIGMLTFSSCDDGNIIEDTFNFSNATVQKCSSASVLYKISDKEALILSIPETNFPNQETPSGTPTIVTITGNTSVIYKKYSTNATTENICGTPTLTVVDQWTAIGGTVEITSTKILDTTNPNNIVGYNHRIVFKNITFSTPEKQVVYDSYEFGNYRTNVTNLNFDYSTAITQNCSGNNLLFKYSINNNALLLDVDATLFNHDTTTEKTRLIDANNKVTYRVYNGPVNTNFFCTAIPPTTPTLTEEWVAQDGVTLTSGIIKVNTVQSGAQYIHTIKLFNTTFKKGVLTYSPAPGADYTFGTYTTN